ncbi:hypothetical protein TNCV_2744411 [Trichonephila clavipes]|nr:hypothetical protein TNCV_2744411 [Trichonephila clavipes]
MSSFLVLSEGDTRNRWRDRQVCPDVGQGTMAPWARRLGREKIRKRTDGRRRRVDGKGERESRRRKKRRKRVGERERGARLVWRKGLSPGLKWKEDERRWRGEWEYELTTPVWHID